MLRKILDYKLSLTEKGKPLHKVRPLITALDTFMYEVPINTSKGPHIRDAVDLKRWMLLVVFALLPCCLMAIWNTGVQKMIFASGNSALIQEFYASSGSFGDYFDFVFKDNRYLEILKLGAMAFLPLVILSYSVGGLWEGFFAVVRGHEIAEGFLVTGILYALILPPTIPYWMAAVGVSAGVIIGKELFGGTGMNILNPALTCRAFLFFTFPGKMTGDVWVGTNPTLIKNSISTINAESGRSSLDAYTQATPLGILNNTPEEVKRIHVDAIASNTIGSDVGTFEHLQNYFYQWSATNQVNATLGKLSPDQLQTFVTTSLEKGGLGLAPENYQAAYEYAALHYGIGHLTDANFFFGNILGCVGETSTLAALIGAFILIITGIGSWRTMLGILLGAFGTAFLFQFFSEQGLAEGAWNTAKFAFPAYKQLMLGGLMFGLVFMATDPVSSPSLNSGRWIYGLIIGIAVIIIRLINPAYPEGMMLAILLGNVFAPVIDHYAVQNFRRKRRVQTA